MSDADQTIRRLTQQVAVLSITVDRIASRLAVGPEIAMELRLVSEILRNRNAVTNIDHRIERLLSMFDSELGDAIDGLEDVLDVQASLLEKGDFGIRK